MLFVTFVFQPGELFGQGLSLENRKAKLSRENRAEVQARQEKIKAELATLKDHPWAGIYAFGMHPGAYKEIAVAPKSGFTYIYESTDVIEMSERDNNGVVRGVPSRFDQNYGEATWEDGRLKLSPVLEVGIFGFGDDPFSKEFVLIPWADRVCLVPADRIIDFCNMANSGQVRCFFRDFHYKMGRLIGKPEVPEKYKPYLLEKPVEGQIIAIGESREFRDGSSDAREMIVTVNRGSRDGILVGMEFYVSNPKNIFAPIRLTQVSENESVGTIKQGIRELTPQIGWSVSTRHPWMVDPAEVVRLEAIQKFNERPGRGPDSHLKYRIEVQEKPEEWQVMFSGKSGIVGDHAMLVKNKATGEWRYVPGR